jgi:ABC-type Fe3+ transport system substrate-binding protein
MRTLDRRTRAAVATVALSLVVTACAGPAATQAPPTAPPAPGTTAAPTAAARTIEDVCADAAGTTATFLSRSEVADEAAINVKFHESYPDIGVTHVQEGPEDSTARLLVEIQAGRPPEGNIVSGNLSSSLPLFENGFVADYDLLALGFPEDAVVEVRGVQVVRRHRAFGGLYYNSETTDPADLPDTYAELLEADQLRGQFMSDPRGVNLGALRLVWTQEDYETYITSLVENLDPVLVRGTSAGVAKLLTGEFVTGDAGKTDEIAQHAATGAPVALKHLDVITTFEIFDTIVEGPSTDAAVCYTYWSVSPEGQAVLFEVTKKQNLDVPPDGLPNGAVIAAIESEEDVLLYGEASTFYADALEGQTTVE